MLNTRANSIILWSVTIAILVTAMAFLRIVLKSALQNKMATATDYLMWTSAHIAKPEYTPYTNVAERINSQNKMTIRQVEAHKQPYRSVVTSTQNETSVNLVAAQGSEDALKTFDLNTVIK